MTTKMRAKMLITGVADVTGYAPGQTTNEVVKIGERLTMMAVGSGQPYNADGSGDEDNNFARWTPTANLDMVVLNPELVGQFKAGQKLYVDFSPADE